MTIENAEKIDPVPCAFCGNAPIVRGEYARHGHEGQERCPLWWLGGTSLLLTWNREMTAILARRRADYIEGCRAADAVAYYEPFDVEASADAYLSQQPADGARDKDLMDPNYGCQERRDERLMEMAKMLDRKFR